MNVVLLPPSDQELIDAIEFYEQQLPGLGHAFLKEFLETMEFIKHFPTAWQKVGRHTHKCPLKKFPYLILYIAEKTQIIITAVAHQHRRPSSYLNR
jgi:hypothetical protein